MYRLISILGVIIVTIISPPSVAKNICPALVIDNNKSGLENASLYINQFIPIHENQIFIDKNSEHVKRNIIYTYNTKKYKQWLACINHELQAFNLDNHYPLLSAKLNYLNQTAEGRLTKSEIILNAVTVCLNDHEDEFEIYYSCVEKIAHRLNNKRQDNEFSDALFQRIEALAKEGNLIAQYNMAAIQLYGVGTKIDIPSAYAWAIVASTVNPPFGKKMADDLYTNLNSDEKRQAELLSMRYLSDYSKIYQRPSITILNSTHQKPHNN